MVAVDMTQEAGERWLLSRQWTKLVDSYLWEFGYIAVEGRHFSSVELQPMVRYGGSEAVSTARELGSTRDLRAPLRIAS